MTKSDLLGLAQWGAHREVAAIEQRLHALQREFPDIFVVNESIVLLKAELRSSDNGLAPRKKNFKYSASWTPARRAKQAKVMRKRLKAMHGRLTKKKPKRTLWKDRWYARLKKRGPEQLSISAHALRTASATLLTSADSYLKDGTIKKQKSGLYAAGPAPKEIETTS
jgi:hypothetical protein